MLPCTSTLVSTFAVHNHTPEMRVVVWERSWSCRHEGYYCGGLLPPLRVAADVGYDAASPTGILELPILTLATAALELSGTFGWVSLVPPRRCKDGYAAGHAKTTS